MLNRTWRLYESSLPRVAQLERIVSVIVFLIGVVFRGLADARAAPVSDFGHAFRFEKRVVAAVGVGLDIAQIVGQVVLRSVNTPVVAFCSEI